jgi:putative phosphoesterase
MRRSRTPTIPNEEGYRILAGETLLGHVKELEKQIQGVRKSDDIEYVHKLRVASRRLRAALTVFDECFKPKLTKKWRKTIKNLTRSVGAARDADVQIQFLQNYSRTIEDAHAAPGLAYIIRLRKSVRMAMQPNIVETLDALESSRILDEIVESCRTITENPSEYNIKTLSTYEKAYNQILPRLNEMLTYQQFVHDEAAATKHHELRIAAKRLRYTIEIFSTIYKGGLSGQISLLKRFQDVLGEMHDYDVWIEELRADKPDVPDEARYGLDKLVGHLTELRKSRYMNFVFLWDDTVAHGLFDRIRHLTDVGPRSEILREILLRDKKVAVISDIHSNLDALQAVLYDAKKLGLQIFLNAGDAVGFNIYPSQVVESLRSAMFLNVIGNVDLEVLEGLRNPKLNRNDAGSKVAIEELSPSDVAFLQSLPKELRLEVDGTDVLLTHGSPQSVDEHIYPDSPTERLEEIALKADADVIITGHSHMPMKREVAGVIFMNPGSVGRPVDGDTKAQYAVLSFDPIRIEFRKVEFDVEAVANAMRKKGLPENSAQVLLQATPSNAIKKKQEELKRRETWKSRLTISKVRDIARKYQPDETHAEQDRRLALMIFSKTKKLHQLGRKERYWLECATLLHDIGLSRSGRGHHKTALNMILNDPQLPFTHEERYIIGSIARYHRKALPDKKHFNLRPLSQVERKKVAVLSSILRVADALDYSHNSIVTRVNVKTFPNHIVLECRFSGNHDSEEMSVNKKKDLFERVFNKDLTIVWKNEFTQR